ncbi:conserved hypothetical protein [Ricinus communis]|uniref:Flagellar motor switch protein FliN-like C-terminal domain-containing protein n=1 Tax=Ricinus communis TaxID=3988 RepID=B9T9Y1_RICCO|nr:conserved hypothetical protein [Ricinus communis]
MIEPIRETLDAGMQSDVDDIDERWVRSLREDVMSASVVVNGTIAEKDVALRDIIDLEPGDVIPVDLGEKIVLTANGVPIMYARLGQSRGNLALQILEKFDRGAG